MIYTGKPNVFKKTGKKYNKFTKDFLTRQKEMSDNVQQKKIKLIEEDNKKKEKDYQNIKKDSILAKKMKKYKKIRVMMTGLKDYIKKIQKKEKLKESLWKLYVCLLLSRLYLKD